MEDIKELLQMPNDLTGKDIQMQFKRIAKNLFNNFCIQCGENKQANYYYFAEIEFYYYDKDKLNEKWNWVTYPRTGKSAGDLFFHYSGFDICFDSNFNDGKFGGILIRSLKDENGKFITGPSVCTLEILNACSKSKRWPEIVPIPNEKNNKKCEMNEHPIERCGINYDESDTKDKPWCFYDRKLFEKYTSKDNCYERIEKARWDFDKKHNGKKPKLTDYLRYYNRFKPTENK